MAQFMSDTKANMVSVEKRCMGAGLLLVSWISKEQIKTKRLKKSVANPEGVQVLSD
jgi:hypothetical protein